MDNNIMRAPLHQWSALQKELLWVYDSEPAVARLKSDHTRGYWVWLIRRGSVQVECKSGNFKAREGSWVISPHEEILQEFSPNAQILSIHFRCQWPSGKNLFIGNQGLVFSKLDYPTLEKSALTLLRLSQQLFPETPRFQLSSQNVDFQTFWKFQQQFIQWLIDFSAVMINQGRLFSQGGELDPRVIQAVQLMNNHPLHLEHPVEYLERETRVGRARLDQLFIQDMQISSRQYWTQRRLQSAIQSLEESDIPIKEIAFQLGFKQASHFTSWMIQHTQKTPKEFRKTSKENRIKGNL